MTNPGRYRYPVPGLPREYMGPGIYVLTSPDGMLYVGSSKEVRKRLNQHRATEHKGWAQRVVAFGDFDKATRFSLEEEACRRLVAAGYTVQNYAYVQPPEVAIKPTKAAAERLRKGVPERWHPEYTIDGISKPMLAWLEHFGAGVTADVAIKRIASGWTPHAAFSTPKRKWTKNP